MPASVKSSALRSPFLWLGIVLLIALGGALVFSDSVAELARYSAEYQRRINQVLSTSLRDVQSGTGSLALWTLVTVCFGYGVVHTLGPGHGKAVVVAYFLDSTRPRAWIEGIFAGGWIAFTHTLAALLLAGALKLSSTVGLFGARSATSRSCRTRSSCWWACGDCGLESRGACTSTGTGITTTHTTTDMTTHTGTVMGTVMATSITTTMSRRSAR